MISDDVRLECLALLSTMPAGASQRWDDAARQVYGLVLRRLDDATARAAVEHAVLSEAWRPSAARLLEIAAERASRIPDAEETCAEIVRLMKPGSCAEPIVWDEAKNTWRPPHPGETPTTHLRVSVPRCYSHPVVARVVEYLGGWSAVADGECSDASLHRRVVEAHASVSQRWREQVLEQLTLPAVERDARYFPEWRPRALVEGSAAVPEDPEMERIRRRTEAYDRRMREVPEPARALRLAR